MIRSPVDPDLVSYYASEVTGGPGHFSFPLTVFADMPDAQRKTIFELYWRQASLEGFAAALSKAELPSAISDRAS